MIGALLALFIQTVRPLLGPAACKYPVSCGIYAVEQLKTKSLLKALKAIIQRLSSCNPFF